MSQPAQRGLHQRRRGLGARSSYSSLPAACRGNRSSHQPGRGAQPAPLVVETQQHLGHGQAHQLGVGFLPQLPGPPPGQPQGRG